MKQILAIPAYTACPECGYALQTDKGLDPKATTVRFLHVTSPVRNCKYDNTFVDISIKDFLIPKGGD